MDILINILVLLHLVGFAAMFGGAFTQMKGPKRVINPAILHGTLTQVVTGLALVGIHEATDGAVNHAKIAVKSVVLIAILVLVLMNRKKDNVAPGAFFGILGLTFLNAAIAKLW